ncbi:hypothetical protein SpCBS45565_g00438 [Spizellomyces sp. 'palustris']|nr:hypothetical protein SpCBS45565_g00438 [Spizellomyces sp. 'palustris']
MSSAPQSPHCPTAKHHGVHSRVASSPSIPSLKLRNIPSSQTSHRQQPTLRSPPSPRSKLSLSFPSSPLTDRTPLYGWMLLIATGIYFVVGMYMLVSLGRPRKESITISTKSSSRVAPDTYYTFLIPLLGPVTVFFIFFNWLGLKFFRHNA